MGRRFKSKAYKQYIKDVNALLPKSTAIPEGKLTVRYNFYFSNKSSDYDNAIKQAQDIICDKYNINDSLIYKAVIEKFIVKKGCEKIEFKFMSYSENKADN